MSEAHGNGDFPSSPTPGSSCGAVRGRFSLPSPRGRGAVAAIEEEEEEPEAPGEQPAAAGDEHGRGLIRRWYRELICSLQQNREDMLGSKTNRLIESLVEANQLFTGVSHPREAALDAQFLVLASHLGQEAASELHSDGTAFDSAAFAGDVLTFMGINDIEESPEGTSGGCLPGNAWHRLGEEAEKHFRRAPTFHYMLGTFKSDPPVPRQWIERQKKAGDGEEKRARLAQLKETEVAPEEATEKAVERILGLLRAYFHSDANTPISFFDFVIDPNSFARTVENLFHVSFLIKDGFARITLDEDKLPIIEPCEEDEGREDARRSPSRNPAVISLSHEEWKKVIEAFEITEPMITPPCARDEDEMETA
ncbi:non-structural maintenance of chromosomes element 4 homolog A-like [Colius striatus]|uniref:non-structural maintenance of chromosomes element 4 homolog A-like n=1 Tax=Colius striatus TaxID=57412 RepID=UPI002B1DE6E4|nr:non-structural maintenance of chromosomes element 4 homolog A-like [Colius striatus]